MSEQGTKDPWGAFSGTADIWARLLLEDCELSLWRWDLPTGAVSFLQGQTGALGYAGADVPCSASDWVARIHPEDVGAITELLQSAKDGEVDAFQVESRVRSAQGEWLWTQIYGRVARRAGDGRVEVIAGLNLDISDRRRTETALQRSEKRYRTLVENQGEGIGIVDERERFTFANPAADQIFGVSPGSLVGRSLQELIPPEEFERILNQTGRRRAGERSSYEVDFYRQDDGQRRTMLVTATPHRREDGTYYAGAFGIFRDITERKEAEARKAQLEERLRQSAKMESLGQLAGGIAHDFNNMLSPILGYSELLLQDLEASDPMRVDIQEIQQAAQRARDLTRQLTAFGRKQVLQVRVVNLNDIVSHSHGMIRRLISEDIAIEVALAPDLGNTLADEGQLQQILLNLTLNARDAISGRGTIRIETENVARGSDTPPEGATEPRVDFVRLTVRDTGHGMDEEVRARAFEPFFSTKPKFKGTGLGLATVHGLVQQHGGLVSIDTAEGEGSAFHVYLPRSLEEVSVSRQHHEAGDLSTHDETVLVVEDEAVVRRQVCRTLRRQGFTVLEAGGGAEAVSLAETHEGAIDVLVTDVVMPQMSGPEVYRAVRELRPDVRVVYMSGYTGDALGERAVLDEDTVFLQKPFTRRSLIAKIEEALVG
ncbi:MAG: PAS domain S-box protein [bacterium]